MPIEATVEPLLTDTPNNGHLHIRDNLLMYIAIQVEPPCKGYHHVTDKKHLPNYLSIIERFNSSFHCFTVLQTANELSLPLGNDM